MMRELDLARHRIEQLVLEHQTTCQQIDVVRCENEAPEYMAYLYTADGVCFPILIELVVDVASFDQADWERMLWPRLGFGAALDDRLGWAAPPVREYRGGECGNKLDACLDRAAHRIFLPGSERKSEMAAFVKRHPAVDLRSS
jgi:hypothetical protein